MITDHIDRITLIPEDRRRTELPAPKSVKIELTGRCNYRCAFCALRTRSVQPKSDMDWSLFQRITTEMRRAGVEEIGPFFLGESFMAPELLEKAIRWCKTDLGFPYIFLTTNGSLADAEIVDKLMDAGLDSLKFSVNFHGQDQFREVAGVSARWWLKSLSHLREARSVRDKGGYTCGIYASSILFDDDQAHKMEGLLEWAVRPYVDEHYFLPLYSMGSLATKREEELGYRPIAGNQARIGALRDPLPCWSAFTEGHVTAQGKLSACCFDADSRWEMGDLNDSSFMESWNSEKFQALRLAHLGEDVSGTVCQECVAYA